MQPWWKERVVYQIYPRSFYDSNGDGVGDIPGIISRLDDIKSLGAGIIWLSPVYRSPGRDNGYDISDYRDINPEFGSMADMDRLIEEAGKRDIKIVMDLVINHTSDRHEWFQKSRRRIEPYTDYYIWRDGRRSISGKSRPPNNWTTFFAEGSWVPDEQRGQYYLHLFAKSQPDLNYRNPKVLEEIKSVMRFWLDRGVAGFRCDVINVIFKSSLDNGKKNIFLKGSEYYISQDGNHDILKELRRDVLDSYDCFTVGETVFVTPKMAGDLCNPERRELNMVFSFQHMEADQFLIKWFKRKFSPRRFMRTLETWQTGLDWNANYLENHDQLRSVSRFGDDRRYWKESAKMLATLLLTLRGTPYIYQGQEIGMTNFDFTDMSEIRDVESMNVDALLRRLGMPAGMRWKFISRSSRDNCRTPYQWDSAVNGGFSTGKPWIGVNANCSRINLEAQRGDGDSIWNWYRRLIAFRAASDILLRGDFTALKTGRHVFAYRRSLEGKSLTVVLNFSPRSQRIDYPGEVLMCTYPSEAGDPPTDTTQGGQILGDNPPDDRLRPFEARVIGD